LEYAGVPIPVDDAVVGEATSSKEGLRVGISHRAADGKRVASVFSASSELKEPRRIELGSVLEGDPPPALRAHNAALFAAWFSRPVATQAASGRRLEVSRIDTASSVPTFSVTQQADESLAFDFAWPLTDAPAPLVAWDEDAATRLPNGVPSRGVIKVQYASQGAKAQIVTGDETDADSPHLTARPGGYWLGWIARRAEEPDDAGRAWVHEGPAEDRSYRWVEVVSLDLAGHPLTPSRAITPKNGHVASFEFLAEGDGASLALVVQDAAEFAEGRGASVVRYVIDPAGKTERTDLVRGGIGQDGQGAVMLLPQAPQHYWLSFTDVDSLAQLILFGPSWDRVGRTTHEPLLDGARVLGAFQKDALYIASPLGGPRVEGRYEVRRLHCE
jgi:hypothetical protein